MTMNGEETLLIDSPLVPDPDADEEMGSTDVEAIADEDLKGSRLLLVRRASSLLIWKEPLVALCNLPALFNQARGRVLPRLNFACVW